MTFVGRLRDFTRSQSRNYQVLLVRGVVTSFLSQLVQNFSNLYIVELGATPLQLSTVRALGSGVSALISIPVGWISDMVSIKRIMIVGMALQVVSIACYAFAQDWVWIIAAIVFGTVTMTLVFRTEGIFIANSLTDGNRAFGYGMRSTIVQFFSIFAPTIGGLLVYFFGGISVEGIRPLYFVQLVGFIIISAYVSLRLEEEEVAEGVEVGELLGDYREMFRSGRYLGRFAFLQALGSITWGLSMPFPFVYAAEFKGADSLTIGYMGTCLVLVSMVLSIPMGTLADTRGRKFAIFLTRPFFWGSYLLLVFAPEGAAWMLMLAWCMRGVMMSSAAWQAMSMEMVPREFRGRWTGFVSLFQNLIRVPAMLLGGWLYESVDPALVFLIPVVVDALVRMPVLLTIPDTINRESSLP
ncbi:MAG: MFS transporter [Candidatus Bathyarchaeota archaeon]|nr:MFS transporter [Candidatus Bathyarchaeota archaeon]